MEPNVSRYIVRAVSDGPALATFVAQARQNPALRVIDTIGPAAEPHTAVIETDAATAALLAESFLQQQQLMIEPDRPLSLFG